jgi:hypothetical protein
MEDAAAKLRLVWWTLAVTAVVCVLVGVRFLTGQVHGPQALGIVLVVGGILGLVGAVDLRHRIPRD